MVDGTIAAALAIIGAIEVITGDTGGRLVVAVALVVLSGSGLALRRWRPDLALSLVVGPLAVAALLGIDLVELFSPLVTSMFATASMALHARRPARSPSLAVVTVAVATVVLRLAEFPEDLLFFGLQFALAWAAGYAVRRQVERVAEVTTRASRREAELEREVERAIADERARVAREIHDIVGHGISLMVVHAGAAEQHAEEPETVRSSTSAIQEVGRQAVADMARLLHVLRSDHAEIGLGPQPGIADIAALCDSIRDAATPTTLLVDVGTDSVPPTIGLTTYRVVQEALTNAVRHSPGAAVDVVVCERAGEVHVRVANQAASAAATPLVTSGHGLVGLTERVRLFGGTLRAEAVEGGGFEVVASIPFARATAP